MVDTGVDRQQAPCPWSETERLAVLRSYAVLDTPPEPAFDDICKIAAHVCRAPVAVVTLIEDTRQFFKAEIGLGLRETPLDGSVCKHAMLQHDLLMVPDTTEDPRFACNPLVTGAPPLRFFAGVPLRSAEGLPLGTLCVLDHAPRPDGLGAGQAEVLQALSRQVMTQLEHRRLLAVLAQREAELERVQEIAGVGGLEVDLRDGFRNRRSPQYLRIHGLPPEAAQESHEAWVRRIHPEDREATERHFKDAIRNGDRDYRAEYRIIRPSDGEVRWIAAIAQIERDADGRAARLIGAHRDITQRRAGEEARELLTRELSHRIKNIFAVVGGLAAVTARGNAAAQDYAEGFLKRLQALARAHDYVRPHGPVAESQTVQGLLRTLLAPYADQGRERIAIAGDDAEIGEQAATALALIVHEQATNAVKYGALSATGGRVEIHSRREGAALSLLWRERGGPTVPGQPQRRGFGSLMVARSTVGQLGGTIQHDWASEGLTMRITMPIENLAR
ncbi:PAS domain-containing protein [Methylobacterium sp. ID0610]|uniref:PAS domain-containing protein n=1 Tax=Methylobacterium carpenticola TaxID=3344827 RepID=UPI0036C00E11